jgi:predicted regulator of Ras-like GTPase activity (Roadblock/LC7/MglB family)
MTDQFPAYGRSARLDRVLSDLLGQAPELQAASVVSFDGLPMASALPVGMDEDRVAAMSAALLSLGERAADNFGRGELNQVYVEGERGTVFLVSADDEAVLVAMGAQGAKVGLLMYEVRRAAIAVAAALRADDAAALALAEDQRVAAEAAQAAEDRAAAHAAEQAAVEAALAERRVQLAGAAAAGPVTEASSETVEEPAPDTDWESAGYYTGGPVEVPAEYAPMATSVAAAWDTPPAEAQPDQAVEPEQVEPEPVAAAVPTNHHANSDLGGWATFTPSDPAARPPRSPDEEPNPWA